MSTLKTRIIAMGLIASLIPVTVMIAMTTVQKIRLERKMNDQVNDQICGGLTKTAIDMLSICKSHEESARRMVHNNVNVAQSILSHKGKLSFSSDTINWVATDQNSKLSENVKLPKMTVGGTWFGQNRNKNVQVPIVDEVAKLVGGTCTIFQKMNSQGDMIRIATNVIGQDGNRAVGTYIPYRNSDGTVSKIISTVMNGRDYIGRAYVVDKWCITAYKPLRDSTGNLIGMIYVGVSQDSVTASLRKALLSTKVGNSGYVFVLGGSGRHRGRYIISKNGEQDGENVWNAKDADGKYFARSMIRSAMQSDNGKISIQKYQWGRSRRSHPETKVAAITCFKPWDWVIGVSTYEKDFEGARMRVGSAMNELQWLMILAGLVSLIIAVALAIRLGRGITGPIDNVTAMLEDIAEGEGDLTKRLRVEGKDEIAQLSARFNTFVGKVHDIVSQVAKAANLVTNSAQGVSATAEEVGCTSQSISETMGMVAVGSRDQSTTIRSSADAMERLNGAISEVAEGAQSQAITVEQTVALIQQINEAIDQVAVRAQKAAANGQEVANVAIAGGEQVQEAVGSINRIMVATERVADIVRQLGENSNQIGMIVETISDIAEQTNLLALNAAIEAARAGEQGRGFAVVADEVRKLAERSSKAAANISELINNTLQMTEHAVAAMNDGSQEVSEGAKLANQAGKALSAIESAITTIMTQVEDISNASRDMNQSSNEVVQAVTAVSAVTQQTTAAVEEMSASSNEVMQQITQVAAFSEESVASANEVASTLQEQSASTEEMAASAEELVKMAEDLQGLVQRFKLAEPHENSNNEYNHSKPADGLRKAA